MHEGQEKIVISSLISFILGVIAGTRLNRCAHQRGERKEREREGWISGLLERRLCRAKHKRLDTLLGLSDDSDEDNSSKIDCFIVLRLAFALLLLICFAGIYDCPFQHLNLRPAWIVPTSLRALLLLAVIIGIAAIGTGRAVMIFSALLVVGLVVGSLGPLCLIQPLSLVGVVADADSARACIVLVFTGLGLSLLLDMIAARARDHLFQFYRDPEGFYPPRNLILAVLNLVEAILIYALFYSAIRVLSPDSFPGVRESQAMSNAWDALWFSLTTMFIADAGIEYTGWARICAATQLFVALFFVAVILATLAGYLTAGTHARQRTSRAQSRQEG